MEGGKRIFNHGGTSSVACCSPVEGVINLVLHERAGCDQEGDSQVISQSDLVIGERQRELPPKTSK